jgi:hypothetical protein
MSFGPALEIVGRLQAQTCFFEIRTAKVCAAEIRALELHV